MVLEQLIICVLAYPICMCMHSVLDILAFHNINLNRLSRCRPVDLVIGLHAVWMECDTFRMWYMFNVLYAYTYSFVTDMFCIVKCNVSNFRSKEYHVTIWWLDQSRNTKTIANVACYTLLQQCHLHSLIVHTVHFFLLLKV